MGKEFAIGITAARMTVSHWHVGDVKGFLSGRCNERDTARTLHLEGVKHQSGATPDGGTSPHLDGADQHSMERGYAQSSQRSDGVKLAVYVNLLSSTYSICEFTSS